MLAGLIRLFIEIGRPGVHLGIIGWKGLKKINSIGKRINIKIRSNLDWRWVGGVIMLLAAVMGLMVYRELVGQLPNLDKLYSPPNLSSKILDRNGKLLYTFYVAEKRSWTPLDKIPESLVKATLAIEDKNFYQHHGISLKGILTAIRYNLKKNEDDKPRGGSTITQQLVRNVFLNNEKSYKRKIKEIILAILAEDRLTKDEILERYFNQVPYGGEIYGVEEAAQKYFGKHVWEITLPEAAFLAGLPAAPSSYSPFGPNRDLAFARQRRVFEELVKSGYISQEQADEYKKLPMEIKEDKQEINAPHFVFFVKDYLAQLGFNQVEKQGLTIKTSLDWDIQKEAQFVVADEVNKVKSLRISNGAAVVLEVKSGEILAMVGSKDYDAEDIDGKYNVTTALRQPGSSIKPLNYAVAIETGKALASSVFYDNPICFQVENQKPYCPTNYGNHYYGVQTLRNSLGNSLNIPAVKTLKLNGLETFVASASAMGISTFKDPSQYGLSLTLGGGEVMMTDMAVAFGVFANAGVRQDLVSILRVENGKGEVLDEYKYIPGERVLSRETSFIIHNILSDDGARSMVFGRGSLLNIKGHPEVAVKTGTTNDLRDNWTIGFTPDYVLVVWVGNNDNSKMSGVVSGTTGAAPIWNKVMAELLKDKQVKKPPMPGNIIGMNVCNLTGGVQPEGGDCEKHYEYYKKEFLPQKNDIYRANVLIDKDSGKIVKETDNKPNTEWQEHSIVNDISGDQYCLDCPVISPTPTPNP